MRVENSMVRGTMIDLSMDTGRKVCYMNFAGRMAGGTLLEQSMGLRRRVCYMNAADRLCAGRCSINRWGSAAGSVT